MVSYGRVTCMKKFSKVIAFVLMFNFVTSGLLQVIPAHASDVVTQIAPKGVDEPSLDSTVIDAPEIIKTEIEEPVVTEPKTEEVQIVTEPEVDQPAPNVQESDTKTETVEEVILPTPVVAETKFYINFEQGKAKISTILKNLLNSDKTTFSDIEYTPRTPSTFPLDFLKNKEEEAKVENSVPIEAVELKKENDASFVDGEILVKYKENKIDLDTASGKAKAEKFIQSKSLETKDYIEESNIVVVEITDDKTVNQKVAELKKDPNVEYVGPNFQYYTTDINTNDTYRGLQWGLDNTGQTVNGISGTVDADIDAEAGWAINEGTNASVIVAVIDTGVAYNHPDLKSNMWDGTNCLDENGVAIEGGCNHGYDFEYDDNTPLPTNFYIGYHGTHVAGIIGAVKDNGKGIIGVAPNVKIMALKTSLTTEEIIRSIHFAEQNGAKIINASWGGGFFDKPLYDAIKEFGDLGGLFIAAAGNNFGDNDADEAFSHHYPSDYDLENIISVASTNQDDLLSYFSSYGLISVDVGAPGQNIYSTILNTTVIEDIVFNENFEGVTPPNIPNGWVAGGVQNNWGTYNFDRGFFAGNVLYGDVVNFPYAQTANTTMSLPPIQLNKYGYDGVTMDFWATCDTEYSTDDWTDYMALEVSTDGKPNEILRWDEEVLDLLNGEYPLNSEHGSVYHFENVYISTSPRSGDTNIKFRWIANGNTDTGGGDGCMIEDVKIIHTTYELGDGSNEEYDYLNGTSMAAPHVVGLAALLWGYQPALSSAEVKNAILENGDPLSALDGKTVTGKRINVEKTLQAVAPAKPSITVSLPNGGPWQVGQTYPVNYGPENIAEGKTITILLVRYKDATSSAISSIGPIGTTTNPGSFELVVPASSLPSNFYKVRVCVDATSTGECFAQGESDDFLSIIPNNPLTNAEVLVYLEQVIRNNTASVFTPKDSPSFDFDLTGDGSVNASDVVKVRNLGNISDTEFQAVSSKLLTATEKRISSTVGDPLYDSYLDFDNDGTVSVADLAIAKNAMDSTRTLASTQIAPDNTGSATPAPSNNSGGGGGGGSSSGRARTIATDPITAPITTPIATPITAPIAEQVLGTGSFNFTLLLKNGSQGNEVMELQKFLNTIGNSLTADGKFGPKTKTAVVEFQVANGLVGDGVVGALTRAALKK